MITDCHLRLFPLPSRPHSPLRSTAFRLSTAYLRQCSNPNLQQGQCATGVPSSRCRRRKTNVFQVCVFLHAYHRDELNRLTITEKLSNQHENVSGDVVVDGEKSNKAMQLSDVTEVGSEEMELGDEVLDSSLILCSHNSHLSDHGCLQEDEIPRVGKRLS
ncbi:hypothetical protein Ahy_A10g049353 isoform B [Arachis hypogaea]|uniref:Uncharacterized protein n=1 Tax=Arachis hypogaea TaxID=3818 RepID=A0A445B713_ARAHY|nr:hypothetical protein Ahy_A10g049353 isoform B [Arachis hypogaea]